MLAKPTKGIHQILERFKGIKFTLEYKYDGERAQVHFFNDEFHVFSRNCEDNTKKYPDLIHSIRKLKQPSVESFVLDCEVVAWDRVEKQILPFQVLSTRKRKNVEQQDITVNVCLYPFDLIYLNGKSLLKEPFSYRRELLHSNFTEQEGEFMFARYKNTENPEDIQAFLDLAVKSSCEGLMVKTLHSEAAYEPAKRSHSWLKVKKDYLDGVSDTLDLVPIGAYYGTGKRTGLYGGFLLACYDADNDLYQSVCKIGTGFKDTDLETFFKFFSDPELHLPQKPLYIDSDTKPDIWLKPTVVWEVQAADFTLSPVHKGAFGLCHNEKVREDKPTDQATSAEQLSEMYQNQFSNGQDRSIL